MKKLFAATLLLASLGGLAALSPVQSSAFTGLKVINSPGSNPLNARNWPSTSSVVVRTYTNGTTLSGTGRCKNIATNMSFMIDGGQSKTWKYNKMKAANTWCQIWHEVPNGSGVYKAGWVRGSFVYPQ